MIGEEDARIAFVRIVDLVIFSGSSVEEVEEEDGSGIWVIVSLPMLFLGEYVFSSMSKVELADVGVSITLTSSKSLIWRNSRQSNL